MLARFYNYTPQQIAEMTRQQQIMLLTDDSGNQQTFNTYADYMKWKAGL